ncbi:MAG: Polyribonucleotide nucleotidyltransferase [Bacteroidetes bacterium ADurb.Bin141]|nr:MAG: polyribonucleotide nucleotidyltransferase [Bacteroidetes bacterium OLB10]MBE7509126.1 polyribonucleotide nucleotidyltransferase [Bacteroidia bacterium]MBX3105169.1 polyribonucleotide nucleotidyltransferase [Bacteroidota bacterium]MCE7954455.1 polyribonucleotide nucleotidyltransferase [Bacteroidetes bacterium CHB6]OQB65820.1 MAG: Polyribonucleotide nucleotidyltransferase [Bacteroidetes bacterium ADurb.Bin141]
MNLGVKHTFSLPDGREITMETGKLAKQADGSVMIRMGDCMILATACAKQDAMPGVDFMPLTVDYQEKYASVGRFPGGFFKREARPSEYEILISRLIDRALRPMFPENFHADTQVLVTLHSGDKKILPDALAALAASTALTISDIPFNGPISEVRVAQIDGKMVINPYTEDLSRATLDLIVAGSAENIVMVEGEMNEVSEATMLEAIRTAHEAIKIQCQAQLDLLAKIGGKTKREYNHEEHDEELRKLVRDETFKKVYETALLGNPNKSERQKAFEAILEEFNTRFTEEELEEKIALIKHYYHEVEYDAVREALLSEKKRLDGRGLTDIRPIWSEVNYIPTAHGSSIFTRGETQSLTTVTLGGKMEEQIIDGAMIEGTKKFLLHYNFPPFSTGEVRPMRGTGRREVGHGNLALRALTKALPPESENPYTIRVVSDILESNGSSSMATVCAGSLALMDAGIKMKSTVAGIAMGLISDGKGRFAILSDILGDEDHLGDMDFKVAGTAKGITATQMDLKVTGLPYEVMAQALEQARQGRMHIIGEMEKTITQARADYKPHAPRIVEFTIEVDQIGAVIGPGGKIIQEIQRESGATITIEEKDNKGYVQIAAVGKESLDKALERVKAIVAVPEVGTVYKGKVKNITTFGAFVEILPGKDGLLHISEISHERLATMDGVFKEGDLVEVKLIGVEEKSGKLKLSRKVLLPKPERPAGEGNKPHESKHRERRLPKENQNTES